MTTIAWDGKTIAADRQAGGVLSVCKLFRLKSGSVLAGAGYFDQCIEIARWLDTGGKEAKKPSLPEDNASSSDVLLVDPDGTAFWLTWPYLRRCKINETTAAVGSGAPYAMGAMAMGANARRAVEIATKLDPHTGKGIDVIRIRK